MQPDGSWCQKNLKGFHVFVVFIGVRRKKGEKMNEAVNTVSVPSLTDKEEAGIFSLMVVKPLVARPIPPK
jgi:hypothetical protein